jgi:hypothetical protein
MWFLLRVGGARVNMDLTLGVPVTVQSWVRLKSYDRHPLWGKWVHHFKPQQVWVLKVGFLNPCARAAGHLCWWVEPDVQICSLISKICLFRCSKLHLRLPLSRMSSQRVTPFLVQWFHRRFIHLVVVPFLQLWVFLATSASLNCSILAMLISFWIT